jgi:hypothetical protein
MVSGTAVFAATSGMLTESSQHSENLWEFLEKNKEIITNGLDLISFVLVTPELIRHFRSSAASTASYILMMFIALLISLPAIFILTAIQQFTYRYAATGWTGFFLYWLIGAILFAPLPFILGDKWEGFFDTLYDKRPDISAWISNHMLLFGVILFVGARLIAFILAIHNLQ